MRRRWMIVALWLLMLVGLAADAPTTRPAERVVVREVHEQSDDAEVAIAIEGDTLHVYATSPKGIGGTRLELVDGKWPANVKVHLRYSADRAFNGLEGPGASLEPPTLDKDNPGMPVRDVTRVQGGFEFAMPSTEMKILYIHWVDAYR